LSIVHIRFSAANRGDSQRAPVLERLLAQATVSLGGPDWRAEAFRALAGPLASPPAVGAAALLAASASSEMSLSPGESPPGALAPTAGAWVCVATPVHLVAGMSNVTLSSDGILSLDAGEADALAADFNRVFGGAEVRLLVGRGGILLCVFDQALEVTTQDPQDAVGHDVFAFQACGRDAPRLRRFMSECDMWLFEHEVNRRRATRAAPPLTGLWLWGGGPVLAALPSIHGWTAGRDPLFAAFGDTREYPRTPGTGVVVSVDAPGTTNWPEFESRWLAPAMAHLQSGGIETLELSVGEHRVRVRKGWRWRFWQRPRPWWETLRPESGRESGPELAEGSESNGI
jgi:hypothetical protein